MARNTLAGKSKGKSKSAKHYAANSKSRKKKLEYDKEYHSTTERKKFRARLNKANRKNKTYGNKDNKDMSHTKNNKLVKEQKQKNRARNRGRK